MRRWRGSLSPPDFSEYLGTQGFGKSSQKWDRDVNEGLKPQTSQDLLDGVPAGRKVWGKPAMKAVKESFPSQAIFRGSHWIFFQSANYHRYSFEQGARALCPRAQGWGRVSSTWGVPMGMNGEPDRGRQGHMGRCGRRGRTEGHTTLTTLPTAPKDERILDGNPARGYRKP